MKQLILVLAVVAALCSCGDRYSVKLRNGAIVKAVDQIDRDYEEGDTVCVYQGTYNDGIWDIEEGGEMKDTIEVSDWVNKNGDTTIYIMEWRIGVVQ